MIKEIIVPAAGESITEADIADWYKSDGDFVDMDEALLELETDKASMDLTAEAAGQLSIKVADGTVKVGDVIGTIDTSKSGSSASAPVAAETAAPTASAPVPAPTPEALTKPPSPAQGHPSPAAAKMAAEKQVNLVTVPGTGKDGRITKADVQSAKPAPPSTAAPTPELQVAPVSGERNERTEKMTRIRKTIMRRLVDVQQTAALLTTFNEVDMTAIMDIRKKYKDKFKEKYNVGLGFMSFFTKAACNALQEFPIMNAQVDGENVIYHDYCDVGIAVATPKGLVVPVIRSAHEMSFKDIESSILNYALKGRDGKITMDEMTGGTFTITNGGTFGSMLSTPILNAPQSAILGMHNIVQRPMAVDGEVKIRPIMYLAVTYDHRIIDGSDAVRFLVRIKEQLEDPTRLLVGI